MAYRNDDQDYGGQDGAGGDAAAEAFEALRAELALVRRAVERLAAERAEVPDVPDYSETLAALFSQVQAAGGRIDAIARSPVLATSHAEVMGQVARSVDHVHNHGRAMLAESSRELDGATRRITAALASAREARMQNMALASAVIVGVLLWATLGGAVLRATPDSWAWPEKAAARLMRLPMWEAGMELAARGSPESFVRVQAADKLGQANAKVIEACRKQARKAGETVRCVVKVGE